MSIRQKGKARTIAVKPMLDPDGSATLRDQLLQRGSPELGRRRRHVGAPDYGGKKQPAADAQRVEDAFAAKMAAFGCDDGEVINAPTSAFLNQAKLPCRKIRAQQSRSTRACSRYRSHVGFGTRSTANTCLTQPCLICGRQPADAHHLRFAQHRALGRKVSDELSSRCAVATIARCTDPVMKRHGGT